jgi:threonyl-tRNA synthetase
MGEEYKAQIIADIPSDEAISLYRQADFIDLCRGPHVPSTGKLKAFKLMKVAGAYWRGDSRNEMLQRIYGTAWLDQKALKAYLHRLEEAEKRDHRRVGKALDLFHVQEEAPGMVFWHDPGLAGLRRSSKLHPPVAARTRLPGSPHPADHRSQSVGTFRPLGQVRDDMFTTASENRDYAVKPMNCPCHIQIFNQGLEELSRPAAAAGRVWLLSPQRAVRHAARA